MGSAQSYISSEAAFTTLVVAGAIALGYTQIGHGSAPSATVSTTPQVDKSGQATKKKQAEPSVVLGGNILQKRRANSNTKSAHPITTSTSFAEPGRVTNAPVILPGQFESTVAPDSQLSDLAPAPSSSLSKNKKSKKKKAKLSTTDPVVQQVAAPSSADYSSEISIKEKTKNTKRQQQLQPSSSQTTGPLQEPTSIDTDGSWTRVGPARRSTTLSKNSPTSLDVTTSDADTGLTPHTGNSSPIAERDTEGEEHSSFLLDIGSRDSGENRRKTLAEKLLPKPRKTGIDELSFFSPLIWQGMIYLTISLLFLSIFFLHYYVCNPLACLKPRITPP